MSAEKIDWTLDQEEAINKTGSNILVSAAAGSGKTAVLVERVIRMLSRKEKPLDIDRLLIMTFTKAAAAQMREKIYKAIREKLKDDPDSTHLKKQLMKVHTAQICTIDSLCADIVKENFQDVDLDPGFSIADEAEIKLMKKDVLKEVLEAHYGDANEDFIRLSDYYMEKDDSKIEDVILMLYDFAISHPEPEKWLDECISPYRGAKEMYSNYEPKDLKSDWMAVYRGIVEKEIDETKRLIEKGIAISRMNHGPSKMESFLSEKAERLKELDGLIFDKRVEKLEEIINDWGSAPRTNCKKEDVYVELKDAALSLNKEAKGKLSSLYETYLYEDFESICKDMAACEGIAKKLVELTLDFSKKFELAKKERNVADFSDIAHFALKVLIKYSEDERIERDLYGKVIYTDTADIMANYYEEIIVDEYQDTNMLQEYLIGALSKERFGKPNVFMVGDVKQSIYGFRMACPDLFVEKYDKYKNDEKAGSLILLNENFRSRKEILDITNKVFEKTMIRDLGGIEYSDGHELNFGRKEENDKEAEDKISSAQKTEISVIEGGGQAAKQAEAYKVAEKIEELVNSKRYTYSDIVIIARTNDHPIMEKMLSDRAIPLIKNTKRGFFGSFEISLTLNLLAIIDNPYQDIPLAAVLHSPICDLSSNELALIKTSAEDCDISLYEAAKSFGPVKDFICKLSEWKECERYMDILSFLELLLDDSGLYNIFRAMPQAESRIANIEYLKDKAKAFSDGPYSGLFNFIRYIREIINADIDFGQAQVKAAKSDAVSMMTIHSSKGLEFPVVILINMGKKGNENDLRGSVIIDRDLGLGIEYRDLSERIKKKTLFMEVVKYKKKRDLVAEELRLLYVAMTRAKEQLIIFGNDKTFSKHFEEWEAVSDAGEKLARSEIIGAANSLTLICKALIREKKADLFTLSKTDLGDIETERIEEIVSHNKDKEKIFALISDDVDISKEKEKFSYVYPFMKACKIQAKISPSQLEGEDKDSKNIMDDEEGAIYKAASFGAKRGNAYHRFLQLFDFSSDEKIKLQLEKMTQNGRMDKEYADLIDEERIEAFLKSDIGKRIKKAALCGKLYREQQFLLGTLTDINNEQTFTGVDASSNIPDEEMLLVQGIIDAYFEEDGEIILVDYKTDRNIDEKSLKERYRRQQDTYAQALEKMYSKPVAEKYLYAISLDKEIRL